MNLRKFKSELRKEFYTSTISILYCVDHLYLSIIKVNPYNKYNGEGSKIMSKICKFCDENNLNITLTPTDIMGSDYDRLINFYKRFGFQFYEEDEMIRKPIN